MDIGDLRREYDGEDLSVRSFPDEPMEVFEDWFLSAMQVEEEANAMVVSTVSAKRMPSSRVMLLKSFDQDKGFVFYTNYKSRKVQEMIMFPHASLLLYWPKSFRQIRVEGTVLRLSEAASDKYFLSRPEESRYSAWRSPQSQRIEEEGMETLRTKHIEKPNTRPVFWGGIRLMPNYYEFFQGKKHRWHDRIVYDLGGGHGLSKKKRQWKKYRLAP